MVNGHYHVGCEFGYVVPDKQSDEHRQTVNLHMPDTDLASTLALYIALGVTSFKIEGRTRSTDHIAQSTAILLRAVNEFFERSREKNLSHYVIHPADTGARQ